MDARTLFLMLHRYTHGVDPPAGLPVRILATPPEYMRIVPPGHNSIAWLIWHIARGEDWAVNAMLRGREEVLARGDWNRRMGISRVDFGPGMTEAEVREFSERVDAEAIKAYYRAVGEETQRFLEEFDFDRLDEPFDAKARLAQIPETIAPEGEMVRTIVEGKTTKRWFLTAMAHTDVMLHLGEADHVYRTVVPGQFA
jgi:hypothetical protein